MCMTRVIVTRGCPRDDNGEIAESNTTPASRVTHAFEPSLASFSSLRAAGALPSFASLGATLFRFRDRHFLGDRRGGIVPPLGRASAEGRFSDGRSARGTVRGAMRLPVASGSGFEERISGWETRTKYCCIPYATSAVPHNARVYLSYAFTNFFDAALFPSLSSIASSRQADAARHGVRRGTGKGSQRGIGETRIKHSFSRRGSGPGAKSRSKYNDARHSAALPPLIPGLPNFSIARGLCASRGSDPGSAGRGTPYPLYALYGMSSSVGISANGVIRLA